MPSRNTKLARSGWTRGSLADLTPAKAPAHAIFPTPRTGGMCGGTGSFNKLKRLVETGHITEEERRRLAQGNGGRTNPPWAEWLMGFPPGWTDVAL